MSLRRFTPGEQALAAEVFGGGIDSARVWLFAIPVWDRAFTPGGRLMVWPVVSARRDFSDPATPRDLQATFVHEMTHVWQAQNGASLILPKIREAPGGASDANERAQGPLGPLHPAQHLDGHRRAVGKA